MKQPFDHAVTAHGATVLRVCRAVLGPHADADDAWSATFLSALEAWPGLPDDVDVEAWLVRVAHRKAIDVTRRRARREIVTDELPERASTRGRADAGTFELWAALAELPPRQRRAVAYHYLGGLPYAQVADLLGGTTDAARKAASDGIKALRTHHLFVADNWKGDPR